SGCAAGVDLVEIVVSAIDRLQPQRDAPLRSLRERPGSGKFAPAAVVGRGFADIAGYHERAARGAKPVLGGFSYDGADRPLRSAEASVLAARRQWRRPDQQIGI